MAGFADFVGDPDLAEGRLLQRAPGGKSGKHHHAGSVLAYVLSGEIRSENSATGPAKVYKAGESFFEPPGSEHLVSENASASEPASLLAVFVADDGPHLTTFDK
jgi:quercetin dioxygenase-like cupin family protein